jgi:Protein of unknown function (DUF3179)
MERDIRLRRPSVLLCLVALSSIALSACTSDEPAGPDATLPPIVDSGGVVRVVQNTPADFPNAVFRTSFDIGPPASGSPVLRDRTTGTLFTLDGFAYSGSLADEGVRMPQLSKLSAFWFAWSIFYPRSEIWGRDELVRDARIGSDPDCLVPCNQIRRLLPADAIPSLPNTGPPEGAPKFVPAGDVALGYLRANDMVVGIFDGIEAKAYPHNVLWWHEIVNDTVGGQPLSVSFCPLTGSALVFTARASGHGTSGSLYNSNLVMYDHATASLFSQLRRQAISGPRKGERLPEIPFVETTWARWVQMHPDTKVLSSETGFRRDYTRYPYGDYRVDNNDTFAVTDPRPDPLFPNKWAVTGVQVGATKRAYVHEEIVRQLGNQAVFRDTIEGMPVWIVFDRISSFLQIFHAGDPSRTLDLEWAVAP